jgi:hypothetical protein
MLYKQRKKSYELEVLEYLNNRMNLTGKFRQYYFSLKKGYEGETHFDSLTENLQCDCLILNDLLLTSNNNDFQIDSLIITSDMIYLFEIKNHDGDYYYESGKFYKVSHAEIINPLHQLDRKETLFRQLLLKHGYNLSLSPSVVFIHSEFTLYQSPMNKPIIYPTQIRQYLDNLNNISSKLNRGHRKLADKLKSLHIERTFQENIPSYEYDKLKKGIVCTKCHSFDMVVSGAECTCPKCGHTEKVAEAVIRSINEFRVLFPDCKITTNKIHDWCLIISSKKRIYRILDSNYKKVGGSRWAYYE